MYKHWTKDIKEELQEKNRDEEKDDAEDKQQRSNLNLTGDNAKLEEKKLKQVKSKPWLQKTSEMKKLTKMLVNKPIKRPHEITGKIIKKKV